MEAALASLPMNLSETYGRMIENIPRELARDAIRLLQFLVHSKQPLTLTEVKEIIDTQIETESPGFDIKRRLFYETDVLHYCPGLVTVVDAADKQLHLAHFTVKEYLVGEHQFNITAASISITKTCLAYLTGISPSHREMHRDFPMVYRAADFWARYAMLAQDSEAIVRATICFLEEEATFQLWTRLYEPDWLFQNTPGSPRGSRLYYSCFLGLVATARYLIDKGAGVNAQGGVYGNALQAASIESHQEIVQLLLDKGADINAQGGEHGNALQAATYIGHQGIIQLLLDKGAAINAQGGKYTNAFQAASLQGNQAIVQLLLDNGAAINAQGGKYSNALQAASFRGHQEVVQLLLDKGADANAQGGKFGKAITAASDRGHREIVQLLLDHETKAI
ncbi:Ankyrin repeat protein [Beauveria bassiana ARSEF 2860]|uniref:Ankyrin repeat protein n=1 Tax=Beauveria bassiana (strain ARSEF 2860) TaxID=655819 RepID=J4UV07_BEAB2|nr:Ankyrin repeat protein [Beauveria bassiana ARSEF 2860]EJP69902.1 Ankyrin repeat protein [Beauveria bassiana ARSEF 2860]